MTLEGAQFICLDEAGNRGRIVKAKGRKFTVGYYTSCDLVVDDERAKGVHCTIECDAFGRITISNFSSDHPIAINGEEVTNKRILFNKTTINILDNSYLWEFATKNVKEFEDIQCGGDVSTPKQQIGIPKQSAFSCPDVKHTQKLEPRFTVHNFAYCIQSDEEGNTSQESNDDNDTSTAAEDNLNVSVKCETKEEKDKSDNIERREVTPEPEECKEKAQETPKMNLINCTNNKENSSSTHKKNHFHLSLCHQSDVVITSFSPRETGVKNEKSFTAILKPKVLVTRAPNTPKSVYSTPKSVLGDDDEDEVDKSRSIINFHTPSTSRKGVATTNTATKNLRNASMHLVDYTTPNKLAPASPYLKSALKASAKKHPIKVFAEEQLGVSALPITPVVSDDTKTSLETPNSVQSVISVDSTDTSSVIEILSDESTPGTNANILLKTPGKSGAGKVQVTTPMRTPQSLMKRAILTSTKKQAPTPQKPEVGQVTPRREPINRIPLRTSIGSLRTPVTPNPPTGRDPPLTRRLSMSTPSRKSMAATRLESTPATNTPSSSRRSSLIPMSASRAQTSTPYGASNRKHAGCKTSPLKRVRKSVGGIPLSSHISKARRSIMSAAPSHYTSIKEKSPQQVMSDRIVTRARRSVCVTPMVARAINMVQATKTASPSVMKKQQQSARKSLASRPAVLFADKQKEVTGGEIADLSRTFVVDSDEEEQLGVPNQKKNEKSVISSTEFSGEKNKDATFSPEKEKPVNATFSPKKDKERDQEQEEINKNAVPKSLEIPLDVEEVAHKEDGEEKSQNNDGKQNGANTNQDTHDDIGDDNKSPQSDATEESFAEIIAISEKEISETNQTSSEVVTEIDETSENGTVSTIPVSNIKPEESEIGFGEESRLESVASETTNGGNICSAATQETIEEIAGNKSLKEDASISAVKNDTMDILEKTTEVVEKQTSFVYKPICEDITLESSVIEKESKDIAVDLNVSKKTTVEKDTLEADSLQDLKTTADIQEVQEERILVVSGDENGEKNCKEVSEETTKILSQPEDANSSQEEQNTTASKDEKDQDVEEVSEVEPEVVVQPKDANSSQEHQNTTPSKDEKKGQDVEEVSEVEPEVAVQLQEVNSSQEEQNTTASKDENDQGVEEFSEVEPEVVVQPEDANSSQEDQNTTPSKDENEKDQDVEEVSEVEPEVAVQLEEVNSSQEEQNTTTSKDEKNQDIEEDSEAESEIVDQPEEVNSSQEEQNTTASNDEKDEDIEEVSGEESEIVDQPEEVNSSQEEQNTTAFKDEKNQDIEEVSEAESEIVDQPEEVKSSHEEQNTTASKDENEKDEDIEEVSGAESEIVAQAAEVNSSQQEQNTVVSKKETDQEVEEASGATSEIVPQPVKSSEKEQSPTISQDEVSEAEQLEILGTEESNNENNLNISHNDEKSVRHQPESTDEVPPEQKISEDIDESEVDLGVVANTSKLLEEIEDVLNKSDEIKQKHLELQDHDGESICTLTEENESEKLTQDSNIESQQSEENSAEENKECEEFQKNIDELETADKRVSETTEKEAEPSKNENTEAELDDEKPASPKSCTNDDDVCAPKPTKKLLETPTCTPKRRSRRNSMLVDDKIGNIDLSLQTVAKKLIKSETEGTLTPRRSSRRKSSSIETEAESKNEMRPLPTFTPRRSARRASMSIETSNSVNTPIGKKNRRASLSAVSEAPLTPKRITRRRSSISLDTEEATRVVQDSTKSSDTEGEDVAKSEEIIEDMGAIIEEEENDEEKEVEAPDSTVDQPLEENITKVNLDEEDISMDVVNEGDAVKVLIEENVCEIVSEPTTTTAAIDTDSEQNDEVSGNVIEEAPSTTVHDLTKGCEGDDAAVQDLTQDEEEEDDVVAVVSESIQDLTQSEENIAAEVNASVQDLTQDEESICKVINDSVQDLTQDEENINEPPADASVQDLTQDEENVVQNVSKDNECLAVQDLTQAEVIEEVNDSNGANESVQDLTQGEENICEDLTNDELDKENLVQSEDNIDDLAAEEEMQTLVVSDDESIYECTKEANDTNSDNIPKTPKSKKSVIIAADSPKTPVLAGMRELLKTPKAEQSTPKFAGIRHLVRTPKTKPEETEEEEADKLQDVQEMVKTPKAATTGIKDPELNPPVEQETDLEVSNADFGGVKELMKTPKSCSTPRFKGMRELMQTPKVISTPVLGGMKELLVTSVQEEQQEPSVSVKNMTGVKELLKTPKTTATPRSRDMRELMQTPKTSSTPISGGVKEHSDTPAQEQPQAEAEVVDLEEDIETTPATAPSKDVGTNLRGIKELLKTPKSSATPRFRGMRELMQTPKSSSTPIMGGVKELLDTPVQEQHTEAEPEVVEPDKEIETISATKSPKDVEQTLRGVKELLNTPKSTVAPRFKGMQTPKTSSTPPLGEVKKLLDNSVQDQPQADVVELEEDIEITQATEPTKDVETNPRDVKELLKTPKSSTSPLFRGMGELLQTPKTSSTPTLGGVKELLNTPVQEEPQTEVIELEKDIEITQATEPTKDVETNPRDVKELLKTPKSSTSPLFRGMGELLQTPKTSSTPTLGGVKELLDTPVQGESQTEAEVVELEEDIETTPATALPKDVGKNLRGVKELLKTPKSSATPRFRGMRELMQTPKTSSTPILGGVKELLDTPVQEEPQTEAEVIELEEDIETTPAIAPPKGVKQNLRGDKELLKTPKSSATPRFKGMRELIQTPKTNSTPTLGGVKELLDTPVQEEPQTDPEVVELEEDIETTPATAPPKDVGTNLRGVKELLKTPKSSSTPRFRGMRELMQTPKTSSTPILGGVKELLDTPVRKEPQIEAQVIELEEDIEITPAIASPKGEEQNLRGDKELLKTPKSSATPRFKGMSEIMQTPKTSSTPILGGVKELSGTPEKELTEDEAEQDEKIEATPAPLTKTIKSSTATPRFKGMRELMQTPKTISTPILSGVKELLETPAQEQPRKDENEQKEIYELVPDVPTTSSKDTHTELRGVKELLNTPKGCSTPRFKGMRELMQTPKVCSTPILGGLKELMDTPKKNQDDGDFDKFLKTPTAKNIMIPALPSSAIIEKNEDSVEMIHSTEYDLNDSHEGGSTHLEELFKTPVASRFVERITASFYGEEGEVEETNKSKKEITDTQTPLRKSLPRKSLMLKTPQFQSPFSAAEVLSDLSKTDVEEWVGQIDPLQQTVNEGDEEDKANKDKPDNSVVNLEDSLIEDNCSESLSIVPETCSKVYLANKSVGNVNNTSETMINLSSLASSTTSNDPLGGTTASKLKQNEKRPITPIIDDAADISGINLLDQTGESVLDESLVVSDDEDTDINQLLNKSSQPQEAQNNTLCEDGNDLTEPLLLSDSEETEKDADNPLPLNETTNNVPKSTVIENALENPISEKGSESTTKEDNESQSSRALDAPSAVNDDVTSKETDEVKEDLRTKKTSEKETSPALDTSSPPKIENEDKIETETDSVKENLSTQKPVTEEESSTNKLEKTHSIECENIFLDDSVEETLPAQRQVNNEAMIETPAQQTVNNETMVETPAQPADKQSNNQPDNEIIEITSDESNDCKVIDNADNEEIPNKETRKSSIQECEDIFMDDSSVSEVCTSQKDTKEVVTTVTVESSSEDGNENTETIEDVDDILNKTEVQEETNVTSKVTAEPNNVSSSTEARSEGEKAACEETTEKTENQEDLVESTDVPQETTENVEETETVEKPNSDSVEPSQNTEAHAEVISIEDSDSCEEVLTTTTEEVDNDRTEVSSDALTTSVRIEPTTENELDTSSQEIVPNKTSQQNENTNDEQVLETTSQEIEQSSEVFSLSTTAKEVLTTTTADIEQNQTSENVAAEAVTEHQQIVIEEEAPILEEATETSENSEQNISELPQNDTDIKTSVMDDEEGISTEKVEASSLDDVVKANAKENIADMEEVEIKDNELRQVSPVSENIESLQLLEPLSPESNDKISTLNEVPTDSKTNAEETNPEKMTSKIVNTVEKTVVTENEEESERDNAEPEPAISDTVPESLKSDGKLNTTIPTKEPPVDSKVTAEDGKNNSSEKEDNPTICTTEIAVEAPSTIGAVKLPDTHSQEVSNNENCAEVNESGSKESELNETKGEDNKESYQSMPKTSSKNTDKPKQTDEAAKDCEINTPETTSEVGDEKQYEAPIAETVETYDIEIKITDTPECVEDKTEIENPHQVGKTPKRRKGSQSSVCSNDSASELHKTRRVRRNSKTEEEDFKTKIAAAELPVVPESEERPNVIKDAEIVPEEDHKTISTMAKTKEEEPEHLEERDDLPTATKLPQQTEESNDNKHSADDHTTVHTDVVGKDGTENVVPEETTDEGKSQSTDEATELVELPQVSEEAKPTAKRAHRKASQDSAHENESNNKKSRRVGRRNAHKDDEVELDTIEENKETSTTKSCSTTDQEKIKESEEQNKDVENDAEEIESKETPAKRSRRKASQESTHEDDTTHTRKTSSRRKAHSNTEEESALDKIEETVDVTAAPESSSEINQETKEETTSKSEETSEPAQCVTQEECKSAAKRSRRKASSDSVHSEEDSATHPRKGRRKVDKTPADTAVLGKIEECKEVSAEECTPTDVHEPPLEVEHQSNEAKLELNKVDASGMDTIEDTPTENIEDDKHASKQTEEQDTNVADTPDPSVLLSKESEVLEVPKETKGQHQETEVAKRRGNKRSRRKPSQESIHEPAKPVVTLAEGANLDRIEESDVRSIAEVHEELEERHQVSEVLKERETKRSRRKASQDCLNKIDGSETAPTEEVKISIVDESSVPLHKGSDVVEVPKETEEHHQDTEVVKGRTNTRGRHKASPVTTGTHLDKIKETEEKPIDGSQSSGISVLLDKQSEALEDTKEIEEQHQDVEVKGGVNKRGRPKASQDSSHEDDGSSTRKCSRRRGPQSAEVEHESNLDKIDEHEETETKSVTDDQKDTVKTSEVIEQKVAEETDVHPKDSKNSKEPINKRGRRKPGYQDVEHAEEATSTGHTRRGRRKAEIAASEKSDIDKTDEPTPKSTTPAVKSETKAVEDVGSKSTNSDHHTRRGVRRKAQDATHDVSKDDNATHQETEQDKSNSKESDQPVVDEVAEAVAPRSRRKASQDIAPGAEKGIKHARRGRNVSTKVEDIVPDKKEATEIVSSPTDLSTVKEAEHVENKHKQPQKRTKHQLETSVADDEADKLLKQTADVEKETENVESTYVEKDGDKKSEEQHEEKSRKVVKRRGAAAQKQDHEHHDEKPSVRYKRGRKVDEETDLHTEEVVHHKPTAEIENKSEESEHHTSPEKPKTTRGATRNVRKKTDNDHDQHQDEHHDEKPSVRSKRGRKVDEETDLHTEEVVHHKPTAEIENKSEESEHHTSPEKPKTTRGATRNVRKKTDNDHDQHQDEHHDHDETKASTRKKASAKQTHAPSHEEKVPASRKRAATRKKDIHEEEHDVHEADISHEEGTAKVHTPEDVKKGRSRRNRDVHEVDTSHEETTAEVHSPEEAKKGRSRGKKGDEHKNVSVAIVEEHADHSASKTQSVETKSKTRKRKESHTEQHEVHTNTEIISPKTPPRVQTSNNESKQTPDSERRARNVPQRRAAIVHHNYDETSDSDKQDKKKKKNDSPRKSLEAPKPANEEATKSLDSSSDPSPAPLTLATTARGRTRKPTARVQKFLEEERAKAESPRKRGALAEASVVDTPTKSQPVKNGGKPAVTDTQVISTPQTSKRLRGKIVAESEEDHEQPHTEAHIVEPDHTTSKTAPKGRKVTRKTKAKKEHDDATDEPPAKKSPQQLIAENEEIPDTTHHSADDSTPTRTTGKRNAAAAAKARIEEDALATAADAPKKSSRAKRVPAKIAVSPAKREQRLASASTEIIDATENLQTEDESHAPEEPKTATKRAPGKAAATISATDSPAVPAKRSRKAKTQTDEIEVDEPKTSRTAARSRKNVHVETPSAEVPQVVDETQAATTKRATRVRRK